MAANTTIMFFEGKLMSIGWLLALLSIMDIYEFNET